MSASTTASAAPRFVPGEPFDVRPAACGFHPWDYVRSCPELTGGQRLLFHFLLGLASKSGRCFASALYVSEHMGRSSRQIKRDFAGLLAAGLIRNSRKGPRGRKASEWSFPFHVLYRPAVDPSQVDVAAVPGWPFKVTRMSPLRQSLKVTHTAGLNRPSDAGLKVPTLSFKVTPMVRKGDTGVTPIRETENPEEKRRLRASSSSKEANEVFEVSVTGKAGSTVTPPEPEPEKAKPLSLNADDDEPEPDRMLTEAEYRKATAPKPEPARTLKAPDEFKARLQERHHELIAAGTLDVEQVLCDVKADLGNCPLSAFLQADSKTTTNPAGLRNPAGHYRALARKTARRTAFAPLQTTLRSVASLQADIEAELRRDQADEKAAALARYSCCSGKGKTPDGAYCGCACGDLLRQCDEHGRLESLAGGCDGSCTDGMTLDGEYCTCAEGQKARRRMEATA